MISKKLNKFQVFNSYKLYVNQANNGSSSWSTLK